MKEIIAKAETLIEALPYLRKYRDKIFVFTYVLNGQPFINFRTVSYMMLNSLELPGLPLASVPSNTSTPLPFEPSANATGTVAMPEPVAPASSSTTP